MMWRTTIRAVDPKDGELKVWDGPHVPGTRKKFAEAYCQVNGLGYCTVEAPVVSEIPTKEDGLTPDWEHQIDYKHHGDN